MSCILYSKAIWLLSELRFRDYLSFSQKGVLNNLFVTLILNTSTWVESLFSYCVVRVDWQVWKICLNSQWSSPLRDKFLSEKMDWFKLTTVCVSRFVSEIQNDRLDDELVLNPTKTTKIVLFILAKIDESSRGTLLVTHPACSLLKTLFFHQSICQYLLLTNEV